MCKKGEDAHLVIGEESMHSGLRVCVCVSCFCYVLHWRSVLSLWLNGSAHNSHYCQCGRLAGAVEYMIR